MAWRTRVRPEWKLLATATFAGLPIAETILSATGEPGRKPPKGRVDYRDVMGNSREGGFLHRAVLQDELRRRAGGRDVEVLSAGTGHPGAHRLWVERHAFRFETNVLLIGITLAVKPSRCGCGASMERI